ncbi:hypothetical protein KP509_04G050300 [Ceratopteris richardii]|uniref:Uncharacterized protein n=1 Tax=Ceratopteris richardii TaxID=49495 RepID=A0A8T2UWU7_CERRI|nr:hypothetical protein KP509_04G050300 [Ceratopteris richardii]
MAGLLMAVSILLFMAITPGLEGEIGVKATSRGLQEQIGHACGGLACIEVYYDTAYATCKSVNGTHLPAFTNCCVLRSCMPHAYGCILHLNNGGEKSCGF